MKSLKIVNELVSLTKNKIKVCLSEKNTFDLLVIKQDLDVLEIIRKKHVDIGYISDLVNRYSDDDYILERYNEIVSTLYKLTKDELNKLKQWLEGNENA